jgi:hypothetical protein
MTTHAMIRPGAAVCRTAGRVHGPTSALVTLAAGAAASLAVMSLLVLMVALVLAACHAVLASPSARQRLARRRERRRWRRRHARREQLLEDAGIEVNELHELTRMVEAVTDRAATATLPTVTYPVEPLLERYAELVVARKRCTIALANANPGQLEDKLALARDAMPRYAEVVTRRIVHARLVAAKCQYLDDELAAVTEALRYCNERATAAEALERPCESEAVASALAYCDAWDAASDE